jgi:hypothetical protein
MNVETSVQSGRPSTMICERKVVEIISGTS